jgi:hypothetical protein
MTANFYISAWEIHTDGLRQIIQQALESEKIAKNDIVWRGPDGSVVVALDPSSLDEEYAEYVDRGTVEEYLDD